MANRRHYANKGELDPGDVRIVGGIVGRENNHGADEGSPAEEEVNRPSGGRRMSNVTGRHDEGSDANETDDGLNETDEALRRNAEDVPGGDTKEDVPVFDRGEEIEKI
jgi:hypothetical protein